MPKLKWKWLEKQSSTYTKSFYDCHGMQVMVGVLASLFLFIPIGASLDTFTMLPNVAWILITAFTPFLVCALGIRHLPKLHWLHGMDRDQSEALEWYDTLSDKEKKQLPNGWDTAVRELGDKRVPRDKPLDYWSDSLSERMLAAGKEVVELYRQQNFQPEIEDFRIPLYLEMMNERKTELERDIKDRKEIEQQIASMP